MKKRVFAALAAAVLLGGALTAPAAAESKYRKGDVNRDGEVSVDDAQLTLKEYTYYGVAGLDHFFDEEQLELGNINGKTSIYTDSFHQEREVVVELNDAWLILKYYTETVSNPDLKEIDIVEWARDKYPGIMGT